MSMDALKNDIKTATDQIKGKQELLSEDLETILLALLMEEDGNESHQS
jgi:hypothetical protein